VVDGAVPHRDFLTFYGPGNLWTVAGAFELLGESVTTERAVGLLYRLVIVLALFVLGLELAGPIGGVLGGVIAALILAAELIWANATYGAIAWALLALVLLVWAVGAQSQQRQAVWSVAAGIAGGLAVLMRFDFAPAVVLGALPLVALLQVSRRVWYAIGLLGAAGVYVPYLVVVGPDKVRRVVSDLVSSTGGRRLPVPTPGNYVGSLLALSLAVTVFFVLLGIVRWRRGAEALTGRLLVSVGLFNAALLPFVMSRADVFHVRPFALVPLSLLPATAVLLVRSSSLALDTRRGLTVLIAGVTVFAIWNHGGFTTDRVRALGDIRHAYRGFLDDESRAPARAVVSRARALTRPGDSLFVGPQDLRRTNYGPTYIYSLLPHLRPASYYMEMNSNTANRAGSGLADELRRADWLILTSDWDGWDEPNDSTKFGSPIPNGVVRSLFCVRFESGTYRLYQRCSRA
jgi:hypothetical protein